MLKKSKERERAVFYYLCTLGRASKQQGGTSITILDPLLHILAEHSTATPPTADLWRLMMLDMAPNGPHRSVKVTSSPNQSAEDREYSHKGDT